MKAIYSKRFGGPEVLEIRDLPSPQPKPDEVLIRVRSVHISIGDIIARTGSHIWPLLWLPARLMMGFFAPKNPIPGGEFAGDIVGIGENVTKFAVGDRVFGFPGMSFGAAAEYMTMPAKGMIAHLPDDVDYDTAAGMGAILAVTSLDFLRKAGVKRGQKVLINGASGGLGRIAVQLAKHFGAEVTGVCSTAKMDMVRALGADHVVDYQAEDVTQNGKKYDIILDMHGNTPFAHFKPSLTPNGVLAPSMFGIWHLLQMAWTKSRSGKKIMCILSEEKPEDLALLGGLMKAGVIAPIIDSRFTLEDIAIAHQRIADNAHKGSVLLTIPPAKLLAAA